MTKAERGYGNEQIRMDKENNYNSGWFRGGGIWNHACLICWVWWRNSCLLWQGISETFHVSIGMASMIVAIIMITFAFFYDRSQIHIGTILYQIVYSFCVDLFANIHVYSAHLWVNALIMLLGIILFAMGTGIYAAASLGRGSYEALTFSLADKNGWQVKAVRMILDIVMVVIGVILGGKFGLCTILTIILSGPVIQFTVSKTKKVFNI